MVEVKKNLFITLTPYHVLLSCAIALEESQPTENHLIVVSDFSDAKDLAESVERWEGCPFEKIRVLPGAYGVTSKWIRQFVYRKNQPEVIRSVRGYEFDRVYVFNDARSEAQIAINYVKSENQNAKMIFVEDGLTAYNSSRRRKLSLAELFLAKIFFGRWWEDVDVLGTSKSIEHIRALFPHAVRSELRSRPLTRLPREPLLNAGIAGLLDRYVEKYKISMESLYNIDAVVVPAHSDVAKEARAYVATLQKLIDALRKLDIRLAVKYHPRESLQDYLSVSDNRGVSCLPRSFPVELLYILASESIKYVVGDLSTSLLTARWLCDNTKVISLAPLLGYRDPQLFNTFRALGIVLVSRMGERDVFA